MADWKSYSRRWVAPEVAQRALRTDSCRDMGSLTAVSEEGDLPSAFPKSHTCCWCSLVVWRQPSVPLQCTLASEDLIHSFDHPLSVPGSLLQLYLQTAILSHKQIPLHNGLLGISRYIQNRNHSSDTSSPATKHAFLLSVPLMIMALLPIMFIGWKHQGSPPFLYSTALPNDSAVKTPDDIPHTLLKAIWTISVLVHLLAISHLNRQMPPNKALG